MPDSSTLPLVLCEAEVAAVHRLSPTFVRVELTAPELADFGVDGPTLDQRIKLVFAAEGKPLPTLTHDDQWYAAWLAVPEEDRGNMRTYTVRAVVGEGAGTRVVVDLVTHGTDGHGEAGPGSRWAAAAEVGSRVLLVGPRRGHGFGGIEFAPGADDRLLLVGDETAVPAVLAILEQVGEGARGAAFLEVPAAEDVQEVTAAPGVEVTWLPRGTAPLGEPLREAVLAHLGGPSGDAGGEAGGEEPEIDPNVWETPTYSGSGEDVTDASGGAGLYAWIAGESKVVTGLRRSLVKDLGMDRRQVAFMGYWREGVSMKG